jgi:hypothetical protein
MQQFLKRMRTFRLSIFLISFVANFGFAAEDFSLVVNNVGIGNNWRTGSITPVNVTVTSSKKEPISAWIQWEVPDADGDTVLWGRPITLTPMGETTTWLYAPTRGWDKPDTVWTIRLREFEDSSPIGELAFLRFSPLSIGAQLVDSRLESIAVIGTRRLGLSNYLPLKPEIKQEASMIVSGLTAKDLPDSWPCYESTDVLVWADATPDLNLRQSQAIEDWVSRGGHLVISLPNLGNQWSLGSTNAPLETLTSGLQTEISQINITKLHFILGRNNNWTNIKVPIRFFGNVHDDWSKDLCPLLWLDDGRVLAVQKRVGFGSVTMIGVDLTNGQLASLGLPETDVLWNRVLGKRSDTPSIKTLDQLDVSSKLSPAIPKVATLPTGKLVAQEIAMSTTASGKLGIVFVIVVLYWIIGGPLSYYILRQRRKLQWSWVLFVLSAAIFTFASWVIAASTSGVSVSLKHFSVLDQVYGSNGQRVTGWFSLFLPNFGKTNVSVQGEENNLLFPWAPPDVSMTPDFIDKREVIVNESNVPSAFNQPARSTTANFAFDWKGFVDEQFYNSIIRISPSDRPSVSKTTTGSNFPKLNGSIKNNTQATIQDVTILLVSSSRPEPASFDVDSSLENSPTWINPKQSGQTLQEIYTWRVPTWRQDSIISLDDLIADSSSSFSNEIDNRYQIEDVFGKGTLSSSDWRAKMEMLSLYSHLKPPVYQKKPNSKQGPKSHHSIRQGGRKLDFSEWFSRPCIIVMGYIPNSPIPVTVTTNGNKINQSQGVTMVRWVYPLEQTQ